jgi:hypothetical protein
VNRKLMLLATALLPFNFLSAQDSQLSSSYESHREHAVQTNELAGHIDSLNDAHKLLDMVATEFSDVIPPRWMTESLRNRIARAEYESAADPGDLISDHRIADAWNDYWEKSALLRTPSSPQPSFTLCATASLPHRN